MSCVCESEMEALYVLAVCVQCVCMCVCVCIHALSMHALRILSTPPFHDVIFFIVLWCQLSLAGHTSLLHLLPHPSKLGVPADGVLLCTEAVGQTN